MYNSYSSTEPRNITVPNLTGQQRRASYLYITIALPGNYSQYPKIAFFVYKVSSLLYYKRLLHCPEIAYTALKYHLRAKPRNQTHWLEITCAVRSRAELLNSETHLDSGRSHTTTDRPDREREDVRDRRQQLKLNTPGRMSGQQSRASAAGGATPYSVNSCKKAPSSFEFSASTILCW